MDVDFAIRIVERAIFGERRFPEIATEDHLEALATLEDNSSSASPLVCSACDVDHGATWADIVTSLRWQFREDAQDGRAVSQPVLEWLSNHGR
jgi:hypothetical protein